MRLVAWLCLCLLTFPFVTADAIGSRPFVHEQVLFPLDPASTDGSAPGFGVVPNSWYGSDVETDGQRIIISARHATMTAAAFLEGGAAYVYEDQGGAWVQTARLGPSIDSPREGFGVGVAISADYAVVLEHLFTSPREGQEELHVYSAPSWTETMLIPGRFEDAALAGDQLLAVDGHNLHCIDLVTGDGVLLPMTGTTVDTDGTSFIVGGADGAIVGEVASCTATESRSFGQSVRTARIDGGTVAVWLTAPYPGTILVGASGLASAAPLTLRPGNQNPSSIDVFQDTLVVGRAQGQNDLGEVDVYRHAGVWVLDETVKSSDSGLDAVAGLAAGGKSDLFGDAVALTGDVLVVGEPGYPTTERLPQAEVWRRPPNPDWDSDGDTVPDVEDVCPGHDDTADVDGDQTPDACDTSDDRDNDGDGLTRDEEDALGTSDDEADSDFDGIDDGDEVERGLDPNNPDQDNDGIRDGDDPDPRFAGFHAYNSGDAVAPPRGTWVPSEAGLDPLYHDVLDAKTTIMAARGDASAPGFSWQPDGSTKIFTNTGGVDAAGVLVMRPQSAVAVGQWGLTDLQCDAGITLTMYVATRDTSSRFGPALVEPVSVECGGDFASTITGGAYVHEWVLVANADVAGGSFQFGQHWQTRA